MPFTVDMATGSRYALAKYDTATPNAVSFNIPLFLFPFTAPPHRHLMDISIVPPLPVPGKGN
jgi:hypothetical protein